jgi:hypothetical protein
MNSRFKIGPVIRRIDDLQNALNADDTLREEAPQILHSFVDGIWPFPGQGSGELHTELHGQPAGTMNLAHRILAGEAFGEMVVAGAGCHLYRTRAKWRRCSA